MTDDGRLTTDEGPKTKDERPPSERSSFVLRFSSVSSAFAAGAVLLLVFALLYLVTLDNGLRSGELLGGDLITHQYAQVQGRFSNAPGYPLYTMGGWLWFHLGRALVGPDANPIAILSSYSALWALVALGLLYALILLVTDHSDGGNWPVAFLTAAFYGVTYFFWYYAVTTEQYASSVAWTLAVFWLAFRWERVRFPRTRGERTRGDRCLLGMALLSGVALAHQVTLPIVLLPLLWFVLSGEPGLLKRPKLIAAAAGLALLPLVSYAYVYAAGATHPEWRGAGQWASTWDWFWGFVSTSQGRSELTWSWTPFLTAEFPALIWRELTVPGLIAGLLGWITLGRRRAIVLYASLALYLVVCWIDRLGNWYQVIMPVYGLLALGIGAGADWLERRARTGENEKRGEGERERSLLGSPAPRLPRALVLLCLIGLLCYRASTSYPLANSRNRPDDTGLAPGWAILADDPPLGTAVFGTVAEQAALNYLTQIWGRRADLRTVTADQAQAALAQGAPLAVTQAILPLAPQEVSPDARYDALGRMLIALHREPDRAIPDGLRSWTHDFGPALRLLGGKAERNPVTGEMVVRLTWQAIEKTAQDWSVSVRLTQDGRDIAQADEVHPVFGAYPTSRWSPGEVVSDAYPLMLPPDARPDRVTVILYRKTPEGGFVNLDAASFPLPQ